jgi:hypothetical protein
MCIVNEVRSVALPNVTDVAGKIIDFGLVVDFGLVKIDELRRIQQWWKVKCRGKCRVPAKSAA